jgi:anti-sigma factor RsiW
MNCEQIVQLLDAYVDNELDIASAALIGTHLNQCDECASALRWITAVHRLDFASIATPCPTVLREEILQKVRASSELSVEPAAMNIAGRTNRWLTAAVAALVIFSLLLLLAQIVVTHRQSQQVLALDVLSAHLRSLQDQHLLDVMSTDQHTVKPWFDGKLDFSPPVKDLASDGFPLIGGRLDYVDGHPAAGLIYHRKKHVINVLIWLAGGRSRDEATSINGYQIISWTDGNMQCSAVSDLNETELDSFVRMLRK